MRDMEQTTISTTNEQRKLEASSIPAAAADQNFLYNTLVAFLSKKNIATLADEICKVYATLLKVREAALFLDDDQHYRVCGSVGIRSVSLSRTSPFIKKAVQFLSFKFSDVIDCFTEALIHARNRLIVKVEIIRAPIRRLLLVESF